MKTTFQLPDGRTAKVKLRDSRTSLKRARLFHGDVIRTPSGQIGFFFYERDFFVFVNADCYRVDSFLSVHNKVDGEFRTLTIALGSDVLFVQRYKREQIPDFNPFCNEDEEDVDDLLWFSNTMNNPKRWDVLREHRFS